MIVSYDIQMPGSVRDAFGRLHEMLKESKLPQEVINAIMQYIEEAN